MAPDTRTFIQKLVSRSYSRHEVRYAGLNVWSRISVPTYQDAGWLSDNWLAEWRDAKRTTARDDVHQFDGVFTIYSYNTPIAWYDPERSEWVVPNVRYSASTGRHQAYVRRALDHYREEPIVPANYRDAAHIRGNVPGIIRDANGRII